VGTVQNSRSTQGFYSGKTVFITGASSGIGEFLAREFFSQGANVALTARRTERLEALAQELNSSQAARLPGAIALKADVTCPEELSVAVRTAAEKFGSVDIVVANAGFGVVGSFEKLSVDDYRRQFETNVFGLLNTLYAGLDELKKSRGQAVLIGSVAGYFSAPASSPYSMSKFAVRALAGAIGPELRNRGISLTHIVPGFVQSEIRQVDNHGVRHPDGEDNVMNWLRMPTDKAARQIVAAVRKRKTEKVITGHGKIVVFLQRHCPWVLYGILSIARVQSRKQAAGARLEKN